MEVVEYDDESSFVEVVGNSIMFPHDATPVTTATLLRTHLPTTSSSTTAPQQLLYPIGQVEHQGRNNSSRSPIFSRAARAAVGAPESALPASPRINRRLVSGDPIVIVSGVHKGKRGTFIRETAARICAQIDGLDSERFLAPKNIQRGDATRAM
jgi:hypothetical protein